MSVVSPWSRGCRRVGGVSMVTRMQTCHWYLHSRMDVDASMVSPWSRGCRHVSGVSVVTWMQTHQQCPCMSLQMVPQMSSDEETSICMVRCQPSSVLNIDQSNVHGTDPLKSFFCGLCSSKMDVSIFTK